MPIEGRIVLGAPITFPFPNGVLFTIATDGGHHVLARVGVDPFVFISHAETLTDGASEVTTTTWRADVAAQLGEVDGVGGAGVVTPLMRIGVPGTNKFIILGQNFDTPENLYQVLGIEYALNAAGDVDYAHKYHYYNDAGNFAPPGFLGGAFGGAVGQALIGTDVYFIADFLGGGGGAMHLAWLPTDTDEVVPVSGSWDDKRFELPGDFAAVLWWNDVTGGAGIFEHADGIGILAYLDATLWHTVIGAGGSNTGQNDISSDFDIPWDDEGKNFVGTPTAFIDDLYTTPSINVLPDGRIELLFIRNYSDVDGMIGVRRFIVTNDLATIISLGFFQVDLTDIAGAGAESSYGYREGDDIIWMIKENAALDFRHTTHTVPTVGDIICGPEDEADAVQECLFNWDECVLVPTHITVEIVSPTVSPGRSLTGREVVVQPEAGCLRVTLHEIPVFTKPQLLLWREYELALNGRVGTCCVPLYEGKLSATPIVATLGADAAIGAVRLTINQSAGADIRPGMHFQVGERAYRLVTGGGSSWKVLPPLRDAITSGTSLNFNDPRLRCRQETDDGMDLLLTHLRFGKRDVTFIEDV